MQNRYKKIVLLTLLFSAGVVQARSFCDTCDVTPCFQPRSQGRDKTRQMVGTVGHTHLYNMESWYGMFSVLFEYTKSFRPEHIARCLFGCSLIDDCNCPDRKMLVQGCTVENRDPRALLADYFYLPQDFKSELTFEPRIRNFLVDLDLYVGLDEWLQGLYFRAYGPITYTRWDLNFCECVESRGTADHAEGYFTPNTIDREKLLENFTEYVKGCDTITGIDNFVFQPLTYAKMDTCKRTKTGFADLRLEFGWNFWQEEDYHVGANIQVAAPTGGEKKPCYLFDALVGNGNHWEAGVGATFHYILWKNEDEARHFGFYLDANVTHLFNTRQFRTFDLCNKPLSRYMLAAKMTDEVTFDLGGYSSSSATTNPANPIPAKAQFANEYAPVANLSTLETKVSIDLQGDVVAMFNYTRDKWSFDFGYNFWGRSCEDIECPDKCNDRCPCPSSLCDINQERKWVLKGNSHMFGFATDADGFTSETPPIALSASQNKAVICGGTNKPNEKSKNKGVDNALFAYAFSDPTQDATGLVITRFLDHTASAHIKTSIQPIFLACDDLNFQETRGISHKFFAHLNYTWWDRENWIPYFGVGGFAEFGESVDDCNTCCTSGACKTCCASPTTQPCCSTCMDCSLSQWGIWVKGGVSFS